VGFLAAFVAPRFYEIRERMTSSCEKMFQHTNATDPSRWKCEVSFGHEGIAQYLRILERSARKRFPSGEAPDGADEAPALPKHFAFQDRHVWV
jgi:hypothetical protein